ncbi:DUF3289 family protein [Brenneria goodwinii]|uniref:DUF3289 family protein n=1 Tax=Brenneria goodwinii TaxID=1109412 RepID=UPI0036E4F5D6
MTITRFPQTIFTTQKSFNDYGANDMRYGDISEDKLKREFGLTNVSNVVDPYTLTRLTAFDNPQSRFAGVYGGVHRGDAVSIQECARLLFEEMQATSLPYSFYGPYKYLINQMLRHFQRKSGTPFTDMQLNAAYRERIISDNSSKSTKLAIQEAVELFIDYNNRGYPQDKLSKEGGL